MEEFAGMNMAEIMQDQLMKENTSVIGSVKNKLGKGARKMTSLEFHCWHGHKGISGKFSATFTAHMHVFESYGGAIVFFGLMVELLCVPY